jgi:hypothetical protein
VKLFVLENESSVVPLLASGDYRAGEDRIVCLNWLALIRMRRAGTGHHFVFGDDLLTADDLGALQERVDAISFGWFRPSGQDVTLVDGISIGELAVGVPASSYFAGVILKYGEIIRQAVSRWPGAECVVHDLAGEGISVQQWIDEDGGLFDKGRLVVQVAGQLGLITVFRTPPRPLIAAFVSNRQSKSKSKPFRALGLWLRTGLEGASNILNRVTCSLRPVGRRIYLFPYDNNQGKLLTRLDRRFILRAMPSTKIGSLLLAGVAFLDFGRGLTQGEDVALPIGASSVELFRAGQPDPQWRQLFVHQGVDYFDLLRPTLAAIADRILPALAVHTWAVRRHLRREGIGTLVLNDTLDERNRAVVAACRVEGVRSVFVDHGIMGLRHRSRTCDRAEPDLVIKPGSYDPYRHRTTRTLALGNPCMDAYAPGRVRPISAIRRVLFLSFEDNFYARMDRFAYQEKYYEEVFSIFPALQAAGIEILYKPHPGESQGYHDYLFRFFDVNASRLRYVQQRPFAKVIREVDLVVSNISSCYYEAQAAGVPTVFMEPAYLADAVNPPLNGESGRDVLRTESGAELLALILGHKNAPGPLLEFLQTFLREQAPLYMGPLDGKVSERILEEVIAQHEQSPSARSPVA